MLPEFSTEPANHLLSNRKPNEVYAGTYKSIGELVYVSILYFEG